MSAAIRARERARAAGRRIGERLTPKQFRAPSLDALNFLTADVRGALGPYITVFLVVDQHWPLGAVGLVGTVGGWAGLLMQTPIGWLLDATSRERGLIALALVALGAGALTVALAPSFWPVLLAIAGMQIVSGVFDPAIAALTVGLFGRRDLTRRMGRNAAFARGGNLTIAVVAGGIAYLGDARDVFLMVPVLAVAGVVAALSIPVGAIDLRRARGLRAGEKEAAAPTRWTALLHTRAFIVFAFATLLFQTADPPLLTLVAQRLGVAHPTLGTVMTSACIVAQQAGMLAAAFVVGHAADRLGHRALLLAGAAIVPVQAVLTALVQPAAWVMAVQLLGGVGVGLFVALTPLLLADVMRGTGRYNLAQGVVATLSALGVTSSNLLSELVTAHLGYGATFLGCALVALAAFALLWFAMPETMAREAP